MNGGGDSGGPERLAGGRRPSIALVHYAAPPVIGGVESVIAAHARLMVADGLDVRIVTGRGRVSPRGWSLRIVPLLNPRHPRIDAAQRELNAGRIPGDFDRLVGQLRAELEPALAGVDVVIAHNVGSLSLNLALTAALRGLADAANDHPATASRFVVWHHDLAATMADYRDTLHDGWPWSLLREAWPGTTTVVVSEHRREEFAALSGLDPASIEVVPNGIDLAWAWKLESKSAGLYERLVRQGIELLVLAPTRITSRKNLELTLSIVNELRAAGRSAAVVVTGPVDPHRPGERAYLQRLLALRSELGLDEVAWLLAAESQAGVPDSVVSDLYRIADLLLISSRDEGFGLPILEAGAGRLPIACTDLPTLREIAGDAALYFALDDPPAAIAARIVDRLEHDPTWRLARRVRFGYAWREVYRRFIAPLLQA
jgi:glycosyltransferase involved in cell wall biosynthesis